MYDIFRKKKKSQISEDHVIHTMYIEVKSTIASRLNVL